MKMGEANFGATYSNRSKSRFKHVLDKSAPRYANATRTRPYATETPTGLSLNAFRALDNFLTTTKGATGIKGGLVEKQDHEKMEEKYEDPMDCKWNALLQDYEMERLRKDYAMDCDMLSFFMACSAWDMENSPVGDCILWEDFKQQLNAVWRRALRSSVHGLKSSDDDGLGDAGLCDNDFKFIQEKFFKPKEADVRAREAGIRLRPRVAEDGEDGDGTDGDSKDGDGDDLRLASARSDRTEEGEVWAERSKMPPNDAVGHQDFKVFWKWFRNVLWFVRKFGDMWAAGRYAGMHKDMPKVMAGFGSDFCKLLSVNEVKSGTFLIYISEKDRSNAIYNHRIGELFLTIATKEENGAVSKRRITVPLDHPTDPIQVRV